MSTEPFTRFWMTMKEKKRRYNFEFNPCNHNPIDDDLGRDR
jgi:hypothetical protein